MEAALTSFSPSEEDIKSGGVRRIYYGVPLDYDEEECLARFRDTVRERQALMPPWCQPIRVDDEARVSLKFLDSVGRNSKKALKHLLKHVKWVNSELPVPQEAVSDLLVRTIQREGIIYTFGHDRRLRPVIILNGAKIIQRNLQPAELLRLCYYVLEYIKNSLMCPGKVETWVILIDLANVPLNQLPISSFKIVMKALTKHYCCTLYRLYVVNAASLITGIWRMVQYFLEDVTRKKIVICDENFRTQIREVVAEEQLERRFGGLCEDVISGFRPGTDSL